MLRFRGTAVGAHCVGTARPVGETGRERMVMAGGAAIGGGITGAAGIDCGIGTGTGCGLPSGCTVAGGGVGAAESSPPPLSVQGSGVSMYLLLSGEGGVGKGDASTA